MKTKLIFGMSILGLLLFTFLIYSLKPDKTDSVQTTHISEKNHSTHQNLNVSISNADLTQNLTLKSSQQIELSKERDNQIDELRAFFESNPKDEQQILDHIVQSISLNPTGISNNLTPYLFSKNKDIQKYTLTALNNAMAPSENELKDPDFVDYGNNELRTHIGIEINNLLSKTNDDDVKQQIISVYDKTNPSHEDTQKMVNYVLQSNQNRTPSDMEIYYLKTSFEKYPDLKPNNLQSYQYAEIYKKL